MATVDIVKSLGPPPDPGGNVAGVAFDTTAVQLRMNVAGTVYNFAPNSTGPAASIPALSTTATLGTHNYVEVTVPTASVLTLRATPFELVPAPGAGRINILLGGTAILVYNSVGYVTSTNNLGVRYVNTSGALASGTVTATGFGDQVVNACSTIAPTGAVVLSSVAVNGALVLHNTGAAEWTTGNSPLKIKLAYMVVAST
jgi:hypothetical protein